MVASWPPTSGATRTSVARTMPMMGAAASWCHQIYPPAPAARTIRPSATRPADLAMGLPPLDEERGNHREHEVDDGKRPQSAPVVRHLPQACAQLIDPNKAVDREIRWEYVAKGEHGLWDCFARPGKARQEELRKAGAEEDERRSLGMLEPSTNRLAHEAGCENEDRRQREQLQRLAKRGKAVEARQHDEVERECRKIDHQVGDAAAQ